MLEEFKKARDEALDKERYQGGEFPWAAFTKGADWAFEWCDKEWDAMKQDRDMFQQKLDSLLAQAEKLVEALEYIIGEAPEEPDTKHFCIYCDMGQAGYASKGCGYHDDRKYVCPVIKAKEALADWEKFKELTKDGL